MANIVLILGQSGTGKSASLRNFKSDEVLVINSAGKPLPFKNKFECVTPAYKSMYRDICEAMDRTKKKVIVIDDAQYIMSYQYMRRIQEKGWEKYNDIQGDFFNIIKRCEELSDDTIVYFLSHIQRDGDGYESIKTIGKMLDEKITIEGMFTTVLKTHVKDGSYSFITQNSGFDTVKSPIGMFNSYAIDNDLKYVDTKIRSYYEIGEGFLTEEEMTEIDEAAKKVDVIKPDADGKRRRSARAAKTEEPVKEEPKAERRQRKAQESKEKEVDPVLVETGKDDVEFTEEKPKRQRKSRTEDLPKALDEDVSVMTDEEAASYVMPVEDKEKTAAMSFYGEEEQAPARRRRRRA